MRYLGWLFLLVGVLFLAGDLYLGLTGDTGLSLRPLGAWWADIDRDSLLLLQPAVERHITPAIWDPGIQTLLEWPASVQFLILGVVLIVLFRKRKKTSGGAKSLDFGKK